MKLFIHLINFSILFIFLSCTPKQSHKKAHSQSSKKFKEIIDKNVITFDTVDWAPYYGINLPEGGPTVEIAKAAFQAVGFKIKVDFIPWKRALSNVRHGKTMGLIGAYITEERKEWAVFNEKPVAQTVSGIVAKKESNIKINSLNDLKEYEIGVLLGSSISPSFDKANFLKKRELSQEILNLKMLLKNRLPFIAGDISVFQSMTKKIEGAKSGDLKLAFKLSSNYLYLAFSKKIKNHMELKNKFDKGLRIIKKSGLYLKILKKHEASNMAYLL